MPWLSRDVPDRHGPSGAGRSLRPRNRGRVVAGVADGEDAAVVPAGHQPSACGGDSPHPFEKGRS